MLSPESANFVPIRQHDPDDDGIQEPSDVMELDTMSSALDFEVFPGIDSIDNRLRQSNMSVLSRYKNNQSSNSGLRRRIARNLHREISRQSFSDQQRRTLSGFSGVNYSPTHSIAFIRWLGEQKRKFYTRLDLDRWLLLICIGVCIGLIAALLKQSIQALDALQWQQTKSFLKEGKLTAGFLCAAAINVTYVVVSAILVTFIHEPAAGGGTPEVMAFLNGIIVHGSLTLKNLIVKFTANVFAVSSGLPAAIQAPIITYGAIVGAGVGQFKSKALGIHPNFFTRFRNAADRREFTTAGVAAGVSAGFNAPIGGLLFAMEDLSSFWTKMLSWQTFFCCVVAAIIAQVFNTAFAGFNFQGQFGTFNVQVVQPIQMHLATLAPALLLGLVGGLLAALFTRLNTFICKRRSLLLAKITNRLLQRLVRILETTLLVLLMTCYSVFLPLGFSCSSVSTSQTHHSADVCCAPTSEQIEKLSAYSCADDPKSNVTVYNPMATLIQGSGTSYLEWLWSRNTHYLFDFHVCLAAFVIYFIMTIWTLGSAIAGGVFVPVLVSGSLYGRAIGVGLCYMWQSVSGTPYPTGTWRWMDPGVMAAIGAAGLLGGVNRIATASTVIVMEMVGDISLVIPNLIAIFVSKMVADQLSKPLFKCQLDTKALPHLDQEPKVFVAGKMINMELCRASDVMSTSTETIHSQENVAKLAKMLLRTEHSGFPVVKYDEETKTEVAYGLITRTELYVILCSDDVYKQERPGTVVHPEIPYEELSVDYIADKTAAEERIRMYARFWVYTQIAVDLESFLNISVPKIDKDYSLYRTYVIFRTLGLRHLVVVNVHNHVVGIITRKDLMPFKMQEQLETLLEQTTSPSGEANCDVRRKSADSLEGVYLFTDEKPPNSMDLLSSGRDIPLPAFRKKSSTMTTLDGLKEEEETRSSTSLAAETGDSDSRQKDSDATMPTVVTVPPTNGRQDWV